MFDYHDNQTCDDIIEEKIGGKKWLEHFNSSPSLFVNATTFGLFVAEQVVELDQSITSNPLSWIHESNLKDLMLWIDLAQPLVQQQTNQKS